jgi:hypothetical protein
MSVDSKSQLDQSEEALPGEDFIARWSRRKLDAQKPPGEKISDPETALTSVHDISQLTDADMPALESLNEDSDYTGFLSPKVSEALRKQALRKLFQSPVFNIRDGLDDYDDDFTSFAKLGDIVTADMKYQLEREAQRLQQHLEAEMTEEDSDGAPNPPTANPASVPVSEQLASAEPGDMQRKSS